ncbi:GntR family transcriptional regulator [Clostridium perfringens]|nr:GntR family transcriptional regulator [Clostridium perfringens]
MCKMKYYEFKKMENYMENNRSNDNLPRYIEVYNKILKNIKAGLYNEENKLPNENKLAEQMGVSRMTLRQSLLLLQEDGIIESKKGVGNFICNQVSYSSAGLEQMMNVLGKCGLTDIDKITCLPKLGTSNFYTDDIFERKVSVVCGSNLYYYFQNKCCAHCFSVIPMDLEFISEYDLLDSKQAEILITNDIYKYAKVIKFEIKIVEDHENLIDNGFDVDTKLFVLVVEKMLDFRGRVICLNKYHIPVQYANIRVNALKK